MLRITMTVSLLALGCAPEEESHHRHDHAADAGRTPVCLDEIGVMCTVAGNGEPALAGDGGPASAASLSLPLDVAFAADGTMLVVDFNNDVIRAIDPDTGIIQRVAGSADLGAEGCSSQLGQDPLDLCLNHPTGVAFDAAGQLLVAGYFNSRLFRIDLAVGRVTGVMGTGQRRYGGEEGPAAAASFDLVSSVVSDGAGGIYLTDQQNQVIRFVDPDGIIHRHAGRCIVDIDLLTGEPLCGEGEQPVACPDSDKLTCGDPAETCSRPCVPSFAGDGGPPLDMRLSLAFGASADPSGQLLLTPGGDLFLSDSRNRRVRLIGRDGVVRTVAGTGEEGSAGDGGPATAATLTSPADLARDDDGSLFIADPWVNCVRRISPDGIIDTVAGVCGAERDFAGDGGPATDARMKVPFGVAVAGGVLYIADTGNQRIRAVRLR